MNSSYSEHYFGNERYMLYMEVMIWLLLLSDIVIATTAVWAYIPSSEENVDVHIITEMTWPSAAEMKRTLSAINISAVG